MRWYLSPSCALKWLEFPAVYHIGKDELYELDESGFSFLRRCSEQDGCQDDYGGAESIDYALQEGILTTTPSETRRPSLRKSPEPSLRYLEIQITRKCNLRCKHCYIGEPDDKELSVGAIVRVLSEFEEMQGLRVLITGGEPLVHREFQDVNKAISGFAFRKILCTNGTLVTPETVRSLHVDEIQISVDGLESGHDALRGNGTYRRAMRAVETAMKAGKDVSVSTMVHTGNLGHFDEMERIFRGCGVRNWTVDVPCVEGNLKDNPLFHLEPYAAGEYLRYGFGEDLHGGGAGYACGLHLMSVMADGNVAKCSFYHETPVGTVDEGLGVCWGRVTPIRIDDLLCDCSLRELCRGGCRFRAECLGDRQGKDLYRCALYEHQGGREFRDARSRALPRRR